VFSHRAGALAGGGLPCSLTCWRERQQSADRALVYGKPARRGGRLHRNLRGLGLTGVCSSCGATPRARWGPFSSAPFFWASRPAWLFAMLGVGRASDMLAHATGLGFGLGFGLLGDTSCVVGKTAWSGDLLDREPLVAVAARLAAGVQTLTAETGRVLQDMCSVVCPVDHEQRKSSSRSHLRGRQRRSAPRVRGETRRSGGNSVGEHGNPARRADVEAVAQQACALLRRTGAQAELYQDGGIALGPRTSGARPQVPTVTIYNHLGCATRGSRRVADAALQAGPPG